MESSKASSSNPERRASHSEDLDESKPFGSIRIRVETIDYFLRRYREDIVKRRSIEGDIEAQLAALEKSLRNEARDRYEMAAVGD